MEFLPTCLLLLGPVVSPSYHLHNYGSNTTGKSSIHMNKLQHHEIKEVLINPFKLSITNFAGGMLQRSFNTTSRHLLGNRFDDSENHRTLFNQKVLSTCRYSPQLRHGKPDKSVRCSLSSKHTQWTVCHLQM